MMVNMIFLLFSVSMVAYSAHGMRLIAQADLDPPDAPDVIVSNVPASRSSFPLPFVTHGIGFLNKGVTFPNTGPQFQPSGVPFMPNAGMLDPPDMPEAGETAGIAMGNGMPTTFNTVNRVQPQPMMQPSFGSFMVRPFPVVGFWG